MVSTTGAQLLPKEALRCFREDLLPLATILTPNIPEAMLLLQDAGLFAKQPESVSDVVEIAKALQKLGPHHILVKGGHLPLSPDGTASAGNDGARSVVNVLCDGQRTTLFKSDFLKSKNTHGTGCSLACKHYAEPSTRPSVVDALNSCHSIQSCPWPGYGTSCTVCDQLRRSRHSNECGYRQRQWSN